MIGDLIQSSVLSMRIISNVNSHMAKELNIPADHNCIGIFTADCDDVSYTALDEATKTAKVKVVYAKSFYGGAANANTKLAGEVIGIISGPSPQEVRAGLDTICHVIKQGAHFVNANEDGSIAYFAHCISKTGTYLSEMAGIAPGDSLAYLIAPPLESMFALDAALKTADVKMAVFFGPPSETNFGGGLLTGSQSACKAACEAFAQAVLSVASCPIKK